MGHKKADNEDMYKAGAGQRKMHDLLPSARALLNYYRGKAESSENSGLDAEKLAGQKIENELKQMKLEEMRGDLQRTAIVDQVHGAIYTRARTSLLGVGRSAAPVVINMDDEKDIAGAINARITKALAEMADFTFSAFVASGGAELIGRLEREEGAAEAGDDDDDEGRGGQDARGSA